VEKTDREVEVYFDKAWKCVHVTVRTLGNAEDHLNPIETIQRRGHVGAGGSDVLRLFVIRLNPSVLVTTDTVTNVCPVGEDSTAGEGINSPPLNHP